MTELRFEKTCSACPEQYEVFKGPKQVGYIRLRHGCLTAYYPNNHSECIYRHSFNDEWKGYFDNEDERTFFLHEICEIITKRIKENKNGRQKRKIRNK